MVKIRENELVCFLSIEYTEIVIYNVIMKIVKLCQSF